MSVSFRGLAVVWRRVRHRLSRMAKPRSPTQRIDRRVGVVGAVVHGETLAVGWLPGIASEVQIESWRRYACSSRATYVASSLGTSSMARPSEGPRPIQHRPLWPKMPVSNRPQPRTLMRSPQWCANYGFTPPGRQPEATRGRGTYLMNATDIGYL